MVALLIKAVIDNLALSWALVAGDVRDGGADHLPADRGAAGLALVGAGDGRRRRPGPGDGASRSGAIPLEGIAIIPVAGIVVGNAMTANTLVGRRAFAALREEQLQYEACLSLGDAAGPGDHLSHPPARTRGPASRARPGQAPPAWSLCPGAFIGVMLGGGSPVQAATAQALVLFGIMAAQTITVLVAERLIGRGACFPSTSRARLID